MTNIISYVIGNKSYISDFHRTPIVLNAVEYFDTNNLHNIQFPHLIKYNSTTVEIIDLSKQLDNCCDKITKTTKILVGEIRGDLKGFLVDKVIEIIDLSVNKNKGDQNTIVQNSEFELIDIEMLFKDLIPKKDSL